MDQLLPLSSALPSRLHRLALAALCRLATNRAGVPSDARPSATRNRRASKLTHAVSIWNSQGQALDSFAADAPKVRRAVGWFQAVRDAGRGEIRGGECEKEARSKMEMHWDIESRGCGRATSEGRLSGASIKCRNAPGVARRSARSAEVRNGWA
ncbi:hypothetical protein B0H11DRAFT_2093233 [Mycena galericulata]|nr:hypothetical protein B0H11DRAFT_2093233 [Mycena galericulata]